MAMPRFEVITLSGDTDEQKTNMLNQRVQAIEEATRRAGNQPRFQSAALAVSQDAGKTQLTILIQYEGGAQGMTTG